MVLASDSAARAGAASGPVPEFDARFRRRMQASDIADELFLPAAQSHWWKARFRLLKGRKAESRTRMTGVRFVAADPEGNNPEPERATQNDLRRLIDSLIRLRQGEACERLCLSGQTFRTSRRGEVARLRFGLASRESEKLSDDEVAARHTYRTIRRAIGRAGFVVEEPKRSFDPGTGLAGLQEWTDELRLRRHRVLWPWLLPLLLLLLLPKCEAPATFFGAPIETDSFVLLVDRSGSMAKHFAALQQEAGRVLGQLAGRGGVAMDVIAYDAGAQSCLGGIRPLDGAARGKVEAFLGGLRSGGGTNLESGLHLAAQEIAAHGEPTTLIILTDAEDSSIAKMVRERQDLLARFQDVAITSFGLTPRLFGPQQDGARPETPSEATLEELAEILGGCFGPKPKTDPR